MFNYRYVFRMWNAMRSTAWILFGATACSAIAQEGKETDSGVASDFFETRIRPILIERCVSCHGSEKQWADLRLDHAAGAMRGGESGPVLVPGKPADSELYRRVIETDRDARMPPDESGPGLTEQQTAWLREWIELGAVWPETGERNTGSMADRLRDHWAFQPLLNVEPPRIEGENLPAKIEHPIDAFIEEKRREEGLPLSPRADARTLLRRAYYDVTGLPPSFASVDAFVRNPSEEHWQQTIDRLLASPAYGEHWGRLWLDVARYSDTKGYVYGREERFYHHAPLYRDWVIQAWNEGMRFDRFIELQLAADRLPDSDKSDWIALGFLTLGRRFLGVEADIIDDRIDVVSRGLMGLTIGCARCHDHKYDPISTKEYYSLYGIFQNSHEQLVALNSNPESTKIESSKLTEKKKEFETYLRPQKDEAEGRIRERISDYLMAQKSLSDYPDVSFSQLSSKEDLLPAIVHRWEAYLHRASRTEDPLFVPWIELSTVDEKGFSTVAIERIAQWKQESNKVHPFVLQYLEKAPQSLRELAELYETMFKRAWGELRIVSSDKDKASEPLLREQYSEEAWESFVRFLTANDSPVVIPTDHMANMEWLWDNGTVVELWKKQSEVERVLLEDPYAYPHTIALRDNDSIFEPRIFRRGNPANKGADAPRGIPQVLGGASEHTIASGSGRLELAKAIVDPRNPLTARVWVNRVWKQYFGAGLVSTPSDFGVRASPPSHPELLDYLASEFIAHGWDNRWLHRLILTSETYRKSSLGPTSESERTSAQSRDPGNRFLWRMNRKRLSFEAMRDSMLANSSLLERTLGGKSQELFANAGATNRRRTIYGLVDRQYLPTVLSVFDYANPDMHSPSRNETTVPQQALFALNHPFVAAQAREIVKGVDSSLSIQSSNEHARRGVAEQIETLVQRILQRTPTDEELRMFVDWIESSEKSSESQEEQLQLKRSRDWSYGYGQVDVEAQKVIGFTELPHRTATHRQGGSKLPDEKLGWVHITSRMIHAGNDIQHSAIRRWTAPVAGAISIRSKAKHLHEQGDGVRGLVVTSRGGILKSHVVAHSEEAFDFDRVDVQVGDTIDFVAELHGSLSYEDLDWVPEIVWGPTVSASDGKSVEPNVQRWNGEADFPRSLQASLRPLEQLAQVLMISNEALFVD